MIHLMLVFRSYFKLNIHVILSFLSFSFRTIYWARLNACNSWITILRWFCHCLAFIHRFQNAKSFFTELLPYKCTEQIYFPIYSNEHFANGCIHFSVSHSKWCHFEFNVVYFLSHIQFNRSKQWKVVNFIEH